jgi:hypothetical protein
MFALSISREIRMILQQKKKTFKIFMQSIHLTVIEMSTCYEKKVKRSQD